MTRSSDGSNFVPRLNRRGSLKVGCSTALGVAAALRGKLAPAWPVTAGRF